MDAQAAGLQLGGQEVARGGDLRAPVLDEGGVGDPGDAGRRARPG